MLYMLIFIYFLPRLSRAFLSDFPLLIVLVLVQIQGHI